MVVGGLPGLARALKQAGVFPNVAGRDSTGEIVALLTSPEVQGRNSDQTVFIFADTITEDSPDWPLSQIVRVLSSNGYKVIVVAKTAKGRDLAQKHPGVGVLPLPVALNAVMYALSTLGYPMPTDLPGMFDPIDIDGYQPASPPPVSTPAVARDDQLPSGALSEPVLGAAQPRFEPTPRVQEPQSSEQANNLPTRPAFGGGWSVPADLAGEPSVVERPLPPTSDPTFGAAAAPAPGPTSTGYGPPPQSQEFAATPSPADPRPSLFSGANQADSRPGLPSTTNPAGTGFSERPGALGAPGAWPAQTPQPHAAGPAASTPWVLAQRQGSSGYYATPTPAARRGWVITVASPKGGAGKSSLTLNLAAYLGMRLRSQGKTVCVVDSNFQQADLGKYLDIYTPNINTIANNPSLLNVDRILEGLVHKSEYNLSALLGPATPDEGNPLNIDANLYNEILELLKQLYDYILIDTPVAEKYHDMFAKFALPKANYIIVPVAPNFPTLHNADNWLHSAVVAPAHSGGAGVDRARIGILLNRAEEDIGCSVDDVRRTMASWNFIGSIPETKEWKAANNRNELIAPKAYGLLLESFAEVMYAATQEPVLIENLSLVKGKKGLLTRLRGVKR